MHMASPILRLLVRPFFPQNLLSPYKNVTATFTMAQATPSSTPITGTIPFSKNLSASSMLVEEAKRKAAYAAVDDFVTDDVNVIGIGSGTTVVYAVHRIKQIQYQTQLRNPKKEFICIPSSFQAKQLIVENGLRLGELEQYPIVDVAIDGADEVDDNLNAIKGGGGAHLQEKILASASKKFIVIADYRKDSNILGTKWKQGVPVEVIPLAHQVVKLRVSKLGGNPVLRQGKAKAGPVVTDNGNFIYDVDFGQIYEPKVLEAHLKAIPGVVEVGLFCDMVERAYFGMEDGNIRSRDKVTKEKELVA